MFTPDRAANWAWFFWGLSWFLAAAWRAPAVRRAGFGAEWLHLLITLAGFVLLFTLYFVPPTAGDSTGMVYELVWRRLWAPPNAVRWVFAAVTVAGFLFCWWARLQLGRLWSGAVTSKADHKIIDTGPYGLVRHPIYTGILLASAGTAALHATASGVIGFVLIFLGFWIKARLEERFLRNELGAETYDAYARRVGMLIPGL